MSTVTLEDTPDYKRFFAEVLAWRRAQGDVTVPEEFARCAAGNYFGLWSYTLAQWEAAGKP